MFEKLINIRNKNNTLKEFVDYIRQGIPSAVFGVTDSFKNLLVSVVDYPVLYVVKDNLTAYSSKKAIEELSDKKVVYIPAKDQTLAMSKAFSKDGTYTRIKALSETENADVIICTAEALMQTFPKTVLSVKLEKNKVIKQEDVISDLVKIGYKRAETCEAKGVFSLRGDVLDVFPINEENPVRIDFFGDNVESIKRFDFESRTNLGFIDDIKILQAEEFVYSEEEYALFGSLIKNEFANAGKERAINLRDKVNDYISAIEVKDNYLLTGLSPLCKDCGDAFNSFVKKDSVVIINEPKGVYDQAVLLEREFNERFESLYSAGGVFEFEKKNFSGLETLIANLKKYRICALSTLSTSVPFFNPLKIINPQVSGVADYRLDVSEAYNDIKNWVYSGYFVLVCTGNMRRAEDFSSSLSDKGIASSIDSDKSLTGVDISTKTLSYGFIYHEEKIAVIGSGNLYGKPLSENRIKSKKQNFFSAPEAGDYCVHEIHGIGRALGNKRISTVEGTKDYVSVEYSGGDILYVPVEQMDLLTRYLGAEKKPKLSKIGGVDFDKIKKAVKESIKKMSFDLKKLYSERSAQEGFRFVADTELEKAFSDAFTFEETPDQIVCNKEIKEDMTSGKVMDRLVCGDVGFGKTEVALRAIFRAIVNGKQTALLAPTTILTEQHYNTAIERFKGFGVRIECLNRFRTAKKQKQILDDLKEGKVDLIIGTHRLLSKDVAFKDLGLLVLDEEQRFGVEHKEKIKLLKKNVDALTLTATPIPRTLHMSLSGIREISVINTPPKKRLPVQVYVTEESDMLIKDAVIREINRGGQTFILYNRIESIFSFAEHVRSILPKVRITVVHGRMDEKVLENSILGFYNGESDILISTTLIENGIDLPKANTLIVIDADTLGLSTLYQLKGRVGRSDRLAYAYFTFKREKILNSVAYERLNAIIEFTEMGSGIKIAMRDLEIRGAGNILGAEQHGHMDKIGYELYSKLLKEEISGEEEKIPDLDIGLSAYIPENYIESSTMRMDTYKEIAEIKSIGAEEEFKKSIIEAYGKLPEETENLIDIAMVKYLAMKIGVSKIKVKKDECCLSFENFKAFDNESLMKKIDDYSGDIKLAFAHEPKLVFLRNNGESNKEILKKMKEFLHFVKIN